MDPDLIDLLAGWRGGDLDDARQAALLDRVRLDAAFRTAFVAEIRMLGMLKAVQSTDPRWLTLEDELGWTAADRPSLEDRVAADIRRQPPTRRARGPWVSVSAGLAASVLLVGLPAVFLWKADRSGPVAKAPDPLPFVAVLVKQDGARWEPTGGPAPTEGSPLSGGRHVLHEGRATLTLFNGVTLSVQGPADLVLESVEKVFCQQGKLRARVPPGAEGFAVRGPGVAVVDLGTEFGLNMPADGPSSLMVFEGKAEVSVLNAEGHTLRSELLEGRRAVSVDPAAGRIVSQEPQPDAYVPAPELIAPGLPLAAGYPEAVRRSRPWGYWRFEGLDGGAVSNELPDRPPLRAIGPLTLTGRPGENRGVHFARTPDEQHLLMDGDWTPSRQTGYAMELWMLAEEVNVGTLIGLLSRPDEPAQKHLFALELTGQGGYHLVHEPCTVRLLDRWPPSHTGGVNVFSRQIYVPFRWHHLVARRVPSRVELYMDGELAGTAPADPGDGTAACRLMVGRLKSGAQLGINQARPFLGRLDELAVYDHPLDPADIRRHYELGRGP